METEPDTSQLSYHKLRSQFVLFTSLGVLLLLVFAFLESVGWIESILFKLIPPLVLMSIYVVNYENKTKGSSYYSYEFADSFYYMGFIFTLFALLMSFLFGDTSNQGAILGNLGVALSTTIYGLAYRAFKVGFDESADAALGDTTKNLRESGRLLNRTI